MLARSVDTNRSARGMSRRIDLGPDLRSLTNTERRVLEAHAAGRTRAQAARSLNLSVHTVSKSLTTAKEKLFAHTLAEAAVTFTRMNAEAEAVGRNALNA